MQIEGIVIVVSAILLDPYATPQLPPTARFMSGDDMPFQLRTADFTTDQAVCSGMPAGGATGFYRFDFHDGGLSYGEVYDFLTFVTQSYRPVSLCDQRLRIPRPAEWAVPVVRYVAR